MADITIEATAYAEFDAVAARGGPFWVSPTVGYVIYVDDLRDLKYRKTANGGANWAAAQNIRTGSIVAYDSWADWQTAGDAGTKIHIAYLDSDSDDLRYVYLDTSDDSVGGDVQIEAAQGTGVLYHTVTRFSFLVSITKARGGNIAVAARYKDGSFVLFRVFYTSPDATIWTSEASPLESDGDLVLLFPGNEADNQDLWAAFWDTSADEISLKTYDNSASSWSEQLIAASMADSTVYVQMDGAIRLSDGHLIFAAWNLYNNAAADLMTWDINGAGSIAAKTNVITNEAETFLASVFVNQVNDDIYVAYVSGTLAEATVRAFYQKSADDAGSWGGESAMQANAEDDEGWISAGAMKAAWGGKFQPYWWNDDDFDLFTNTDNGISIAAAGPAAAGGSGGLAAAAMALLT